MKVVSWLEGEGVSEAEEESISLELNLTIAFLAYSTGRDCEKRGHEVSRDEDEDRG